MKRLKGYGTKDLGSLSVDFATTRKFEGDKRDVFTATYSRTLMKDASIFATFRRIRETESANEFFVGITYYLGKDTFLSAGYQKSEDVKTETLQVQKNPPFGEGFGYRMLLERTSLLDDTTYTINPYLQYNSKYAIFTGEYKEDHSKEGLSETYQFSASGGIAYVGNTIGLSRPINDSFGVVRVGDVEGVRVYQNNQEIGRTNKSGKVFLPNLLSYYDNLISINDKDIPVDYSIAETIKYVTPPLRSGSLVEFELTKIQAITGWLRIRVDGQVRPVEFHEVRMIIDEKEFTFITGRDGEFYLENIKPGRYKASFKYMEKTCCFDIMIPETDEMIIDLKEVVCETIR